MRPDFSGLRTVLLGGCSDRIPIAELWIAPEIKEAFLGRPQRSPADEIAFWLQAGYDHVPVPVEINFFSGRFSTVRQGPDVAPAFTTLAEAEQHRWPDPAMCDLSSLDALARCLPGNMRIIPTIGGLVYHPSILLGFENLCLGVAENSALVEYVFAQVAACITAVIRRLAAHPAVGAIWFSSDMAFGTSLMISPSALRKYVFPHMKVVADIAHAYDLPLIFHSDGNLTEVIPDLIAAGINALHPIEPAAMDILAIRKKYGTNLCLIGNVDLGEVLIRGTPADVRREAQRLVAAFAGQGGFVLGSSNSIPAAVPVENFKALIGGRAAG